MFQYKDRVFDSSIIQERANESFSVSELARNLGIASSRGRPHRNLLLYINENSINIEHFSPYRRKMYLSDRSCSLSQILVEHSTYTNGARIKKRLIKELGYKDECSSCHIENSWNGKELTIELDHVNGISNDNRIENLRFLCPNCHSQTENYRSKNK